MIADLDKTLEQLLIAELPITNGEIDIKFELPNRTWAAKLSRPTINLFLFEVRENANLRLHQWERVGGNGHAPNQPAEQKRSPFRLDCQYMLTAWATDPQDEHRLLTRAMMALFRFPFLPTDYFVGEMKTQAYPVPARLAAHDKLTNVAEMWGALDNELRPTLSYALTLALDPWQIITTSIVSDKSIRLVQSEGDA